MYNGKTKISLKVVLFVIRVALKCTFSPIKAACSWKVRTYSVKMLHLHWCLWGCCLCAGVFLWAQSQRLQWEQSWLQAVGRGMHQDLVPNTRTWLLALPVERRCHGVWSACDPPVATCTLWHESHLGCGCELGSLGHSSLGHHEGWWEAALGHCRSGILLSYTVVSPLTVSLLPSPFCFSCW